MSNDFGRVDARFLDRLMASPRGRAFMLGFMANAEEADEQGVFDLLERRVDDPQLQKMVRIHRDDEVRHARILRECIARNGVIPRAVPAELEIVPYLERSLGSVAARFLDAKAGVMEAYAFLLVVEERAVSQFPNIANALRPYDPASAAVIDGIVEDEKRHVKYARAISKRYAPDAATLERTITEMRVAEERANAEHGATFLAFAVNADLLAINSIERFLWRGMSALALAAEPRRTFSVAPSGA